MFNRKGIFTKNQPYIFKKVVEKLLFPHFNVSSNEPTARARVTIRHNNLISMYKSFTYHDRHTDRPDKLFSRCSLKGNISKTMKNQLDVYLK